MSHAGPSVAFHTGVSDPVGHAIRLTRKALSLGSRVLVIGPDQPVRELDEQLWTADPGSFVAHAVWRADVANSTRLKHATVWLCGPAAGDVPAERDVLINIGLPVPGNAGAFAKVIEVVSADPAERGPGQQRWRHWRERGITPDHHTFS
jgi:DNA polymerase-3 subunit chi